MTNFNLYISGNIRFMASKQPLKLFGIAQKLTTWGIRITKFFKHRILTKRKNAVMIGGDQTKLQLKLFQKLAKTWEVTHLTSKAANHPEKDNHNKDMVKGHTVNAANKFITELKFDNNYAEIESMLTGKQFESVIVLSDKQASKGYDFGDEGFATDYLDIHSEKLNKNVFAYRLAHKYLTTSGVVLLSCSEQDFLKADLKDRFEVKNPQLLVTQPIGNSLPSDNIIDAQTTYLGVVLGDRDYTDLNSWSVVVLDRQYSQIDPEGTASYYSDWAEGRRLPMPGSFALFKRTKQNANKISYVEYL